MQAAGIAVVFVIELAAGVQYGKDHFDAGNTHRGMGIHRHAAPVVKDAGGAVAVQCYGDL